MKNKLFKVCTLGFVLATLLTGCNSKKGEVSKIKKNEEIQYVVESKLDDIYGIQLNRYTNEYQLDAMYSDSKDSLLQRDEVSNVDVITKEDDVYEAVITLDADWSDVDEYEYILLIKNKTDYISLYQTSPNINKDNVKKIGAELKEKFTKSSDFKKTFDEYTKEKDLNVDDALGCNGLDATCKDSKVATPLKEKAYTKTDKKVVSVNLNYYRVSSDTVKGIVEAVSEDEEIIWSQDKGTVPYGIGLVGYISEDCNQYFYIGTFTGIDAVDKQTSEIVWSSEFKSQPILYKFVETEDKLFILEGDNSVTLEVKDLKDGKTIHFNDNLNKYVAYNNGTEEDYYDIDFSTAGYYKNGKIMCDVYDYSTDDIKKVGKLVIDSNDYTIKFEKE